MGFVKNEAIEEMQATGERLVWSAEHRDEADVREALEAGAWPETRRGGDPAFHGAALNGHIEIVRLLLEHTGLT
jgi:ankyrin repeat protein